ncbi:hypothetical protein H9Q13_08095 [Pontibacter sp. JH31]|uniref:SWFGD domain-containing protein n=1 Tax=Pontibacter aquaedesilientis TaxID=2766980 RepID=A0ABR7XFQ8_9BACT|nr:hypothetical protein [Pontibacter aquaedesilientis]MBD1397124.1 hypothetical protein [Pontibacter aquaedesilientis]
MRYNERDHESDHRNQGRNAGNRNNLSDYLSRYEDSGSYRGRHDMTNESRQDRNRDYQHERHMQGSMHQNEWGGSGWHRDHDRPNYDTRNQSEEDHWRYGDPNPQSDYKQQGGYTRSRGTGWHNEGSDYGKPRYARQDNSYQSTGHGRRIDQYGRDEHYNFAHGRQDGRRSLENPENLDDRYYDRREQSDSSRNDYGRQYGANYDHRSRSSHQGNDSHDFDHTSDDYPSRSPKGYGYRSGPDYSASSPITNYGPGVRGYQK